MMSTIPDLISSKPNSDLHLPVTIDLQSYFQNKISQRKIFVQLAFSALFNLRYQGSETKKGIYHLY